MLSLTSRRCASLMRNTALRAPTTRSMAISATVKDATDTSEMQFPAPSKVSLSAMAGEIAQDISDFYSDPNSSIHLPTELKMELKDEIDKKTKQIAGDMLKDIDFIPTSQVDGDISIADNPLFGSYEKSRK